MESFIVWSHKTHISAQVTDLHPVGYRHTWDEGHILLELSASVYTIHRTTRAPSYYLYQYWLIIIGLVAFPEGKFTGNAQDMLLRVSKLLIWNNSRVFQGPCSCPLRNDSVTTTKHRATNHAAMIWAPPLLAFCDGNPLVSSGFPSQRVTNVELWC